MRSSESSQACRNPSQRSEPLGLRVLPNRDPGVKPFKHVICTSLLLFLFCVNIKYTNLAGLRAWLGPLRSSRTDSFISSFGVSTISNEDESAMILFTLTVISALLQSCVFPVQLKQFCKWVIFDGFEATEDFIWQVTRINKYICSHSSSWNKCTCWKMAMEGLWGTLSLCVSVCEEKSHVHPGIHLSTLKY